MKTYHTVLWDLPTYGQAKMIIWNPQSYPREQVREAAIFILGTLNARREDVDQATLLL